MFVMSHNAVQRVLGSRDSFRSNNVCRLKAEHGQVEAMSKHDYVSQDVGCFVVVWLEGNMTEEGCKGFLVLNKPCLKLQHSLLWKKRRLFLIIEFPDDGGEKKEACLHCVRKAKKTNENQRKDTLPACSFLF